MSKEYSIVESTESDKFAIQIETGEFAGVQYNYGTVRVVEDEQNDQAVLQFNFVIEKTNDKYEIKDLEYNEEFQKRVGDILVDVFEENNNNSALLDEDEDEHIIIDDEIG